jgi:hypothetical protein
VIALKPAGTSRFRTRGTDSTLSNPSRCA